jgi:hypothetical protein
MGSCPGVEITAIPGQLLIRKPIAEFLLSRGGDLNWVRHDRKTPCDVAQECGDENLIPWRYARGGTEVRRGKSSRSAFQPAAYFFCSIGKGIPTDFLIDLNSSPAFHNRNSFMKQNDA